MPELITTQARVQRSIFHALRKRVVELGYYPDITLYGDTTLEYNRLQADIALIKLDKGFVVEVYGNSSARAKYEKDSPRIVVFVSKVYEGDVGAPPGLIHIKQTILGVDKYNSGILPSQSSNIVLSIHLLTKKSKEEILLNSILSYVLGQRSFIPYYDDPTQRFFIQQSTFNDLDDANENNLEKAYTYTVTDIYLTDTIIVNTNISPIKEIALNSEATNQFPNANI